MTFRATLIALVFLALASAMLPSQALAIEASESPAMQALPVGAACPAVTFAGKVSPEAAKELGLPHEQTGLPLKDLKAPAVILVVYSMYCPYCQREAPDLNALHALIKSRGLDGQVKLIGLAAGNSEFEVSVYRDKFGITFPLFPDPEFTTYMPLGQVGTPFFYTLKRQGEGYVIVGARLGRMGSPETFLNSVLVNAGIKEK